MGRFSIRWPPKMLISPLYWVATRCLNVDVPFEFETNFKVLGHLENQGSNTKYLSYVQDTLLDGHQILNIQF
jgi:hypothetical protein